MVSGEHEAPESSAAVEALPDAEPRWRSSMTSVAREIHRLSLGCWGADRAVTIVGRNPTLGGLLKKAKKAAAFSEPVLITGESGVGKESVAQSIYLLSPRCGAPFVSVNCPQHRDENLTVSELFGHRKGSFTGATTDRKGFFETATGGVVFMDEIGDLPMTAQVMLLRALASNEFRPLGSDGIRRMDVRAVAATNRPLEKLVVAQQFRNDLFFRLRYFHLKIPPLRERGEDWFLLSEYFLDLLQAQHGVRKWFSEASVRALEKYTWPGNVRELRSIVTTGYAMSDGVEIEPEDFLSMMEEGDATLEEPESENPLFRMIRKGESFWKVVHGPFIRRDLNRGQVKDVIRKGLSETGGSYRDVLVLFNIPATEYQRFMDFLRHHALKP